MHNVNTNVIRMNGGIIARFTFMHTAATVHVDTLISYLPGLNYVFFSAHTSCMTNQDAVVVLFWFFPDWNLF